MKVMPVISGITYKKNHQSFGNFNSENRESTYEYDPKESFSPLRQAIESRYGRKLAELAELASTLDLTPQEYNVRLSKIKKEHEQELKLLDDNYS